MNSNIDVVVNVIIRDYIIVMHSQIMLSIIISVYFITLKRYISAFCIMCYVFLAVAV